MSLEQTITGDIAAAMKARNPERLSTLRMLKTALVNKGVEKNRALEPAEELQVVSALVKQRRESIDQFTSGGRADLADKERSEISILETYLPPPVGPEELDAAIAQAIADTSASGPKDMGKVMKAVMALLAGKTTDGKVVSDRVKARLS
ncbi:MAG TPA: GatB/YqeY domain-containing protein [Vicinamibacterales bacterium]|nr:GatB/YqeY domain-containing protein [Vicinamibacterales bacterium]